MFRMLKKKKIYPAYEQDIILMIPNGEKRKAKSEVQRWQYIGVQ